MEEKQILEYFAQFIRNETGISYNEVTFYQLKTRLELVGKQLGINSIEDLLKTAQMSGIRGTMKDLLLDLATNNETSFFRDSAVFDVIAQKIVPELLKARGDFPIRIWSAASSTGQEIYSLAFMLKEMTIRYPNLKWQLTASDISDRVLERARKGKYSQLEVQRGLSATRLVNNLTLVEDSGDGLVWQVTGNVPSSIQFKKLNLIEAWPQSHGPFDLILCRNVLIYQTVEQKKKVIEQMAGRLDPHGYLILGGAESLFGLSDTFKQMPFDNTVVYSPKPSDKTLVKSA